MLATLNTATSRINGGQVKDLLNVIGAVSSEETNIRIPKGHPLFQNTEREWFRFCNLKAFAQSDSTSTRSVLKQIYDSQMASEAFAQEPMAVLGMCLLEPIFEYIRKRLEKATNKSLVWACGSCLQRDWLPVILARFADMSRQTLVLEYNITLASGQSVDMLGFLEGLRDMETREALLNDYPVLQERLQDVAFQQAEVVAEFVERLCQDEADLRNLMTVSPGPLLPVRFQFSEGDLHNNGRAVIIVEFSREQRLVYKPRNLAIENAFYDLLSELNTEVEEVNFRLCRFICRENYGWAEYIDASPCQSVGECSTFYTKVGGLLAIVHLLGGFDLHNENIIAAGPDPVLIDLETLFHSFKNGSYQGRDDPYLQAVEYPAVEALLSSVMTTLMLPQHSRDENVSGIGGKNSAGQVARRYNYERNSIDYIEIGQKQFFHRPQLNGDYVEPSAFSDEIISGFDAVYRAFMSSPQRWASDDGALGKMQKAPARIVLRDTQIYTSLIEQSYHPTLLQDPSARWMHFLNLWAHAKEVPTTVPLVTQELQQMYQDDVPYFWHYPEDTKVYSTEGKCTAYQFDASGFACVLKRLFGLSEKDLRIQKWIIAGAIERGIRGEKRRLPVGQPAPVTQQELQKALALTHAQIIDAAFENETMLDWLTVTPTPSETLELSPLDITLYNGVAGMLMYFAWYVQYTGDTEAKRHRDKLICNLKTQLKTDWNNFELPGAMNGLGGVAYIYGHLAVLIDDPAYFDEGEEILQRALDLQRADPGFFDLIGGSAGLILVALSLYESSARPAFLEQAKQFCDVLFASVRTDEHGSYWAGTDDERPLTGLSHGYSGIALALASLNRYAPDPRLQDMVTHLLRREALDYVPSRKNWLDWRYVNLNQARDDAAHFQHHWCNGSAGIGLTRLRLCELGWKGEEVIEDIRSAAISTYAGGLRLNHSLCHGDFGNLDFLEQAAKRLDDESLQQTVNEILGESCRDIIGGKIFGGASRRVTPPDLMTGLSGVAWGLMRQLSPDAIPDILRFAAPRNIIS